MHKFSVCSCKSQDFAQSQKILALSNDRVTATFRNSALHLVKTKSKTKQQMISQRDHVIVRLLFIFINRPSVAVLQTKL